MIRPSVVGMTIHSAHPFLEPEEERDAGRRLRGRLGGAVVLLTAGGQDGLRDRTGLTVSSVMVAHGDPPHVLALVDPESELVGELEHTHRAVVQLLSWEHRALADAFAGVAPAPGGPFRMADWEQTDWGPRLVSASTWAGLVMHESPTQVGWSLLVNAVVGHLELGDPGGATEPLVHRRGRYQRPAAGS